MYEQHDYLIPDLIREGLVTKARITYLKSLRKKFTQPKKHPKISLVELLFLMEELTEEKIAFLQSENWDVKYLNLDLLVDVPYEAIEAVSREMAFIYQIFPIKKEGAVLTVAMSNIEDLKFKIHLHGQLGFSIDPVVATPSAIKRAIKRHYSTLPESTCQKKFTRVYWTNLNKVYQVLTYLQDNIHLPKALPWVFFMIKILYYRINQPSTFRICQQQGYTSLISPTSTSPPELPLQKQ